MDYYIIRLDKKSKNQKIQRVVQQIMLSSNRSRFCDWLMIHKAVKLHPDAIWDYATRAPNIKSLNLIFHDEQMANWYGEFLEEFLNTKCIVKLMRYAKDDIQN